MIFYFTGTGNCLHVARELAAGERAGAQPLSIPQEMRREGDLTYADEAIGIVYPLYGHLMPAMVREFIHRATFDTPYFFLLATYGRRHANGVELAQEEARSAGIEPAYISTLLMVDNWLPNFDMDEESALIPEKRIDENLARIKNDVSARKRWIEPVTDADRTAHEEYLSFGLKFEASDLGGFLAINEDACTGCGTCARVCPAGCIAMEDGAARRDAMAGMGCNACLACIHVCPASAISLPMGEKNPAARFRNEHVRLADIVQANNQLG